MKKQPLFLICNDDGVHAPGIKVLRQALKDFGRSIVVAPHVERSASSHALTLHSPLRVEEIEPDVFAVEGTPADCVHLALRKLVPEKPDWVISGINRGGNLGFDTLYSGTVAAAMEACLNGIKSIAVSSEGEPPLQYETAAYVVQKILTCIDDSSFPSSVMLNVNVPDIPINELAGIRTAICGLRHYSDEIISGVDPRGRSYYWIGGGGKKYHELPESDCLLINQKYATITPLKPSFFAHEAMSYVKDIEQRCSKS